MYSEENKILDRIIRWLSYFLVFALLIAIVLVLFEPTSRIVSDISQTQDVSEYNAPKITPSRSAQTTKKNLQPVSVRSVTTNNSNESGDASSGDIDQDIAHDSQASLAENAPLDSGLDDQQLIAVAHNSDQADPTLLSIRETPDTSEGTNSRQSDSRQSEPEDIPEETPILGEKEIAGQVQDVRGQPVSAVTVALHLQSPGPDAPDSSFPRQTQSDTEGEFIFQNLPDIDYRLTINEQDDYDSVSYFTRAGMSDLVLVLPDKQIVTIQGHVSDNEDQPIPGVSVVINGDDKTKTDSGGYYQISKRLTVNSNYRLGFVIDGFSEANEIIKITSNSMTIDKRLQPISAIKLTGQVINDLGMPLPRASIWLFSGSVEIERRTRSNNEGYFTIDDLKAGSDYQFNVSYSGHEKYRLNNLSITESSPPMQVELSSLTTGTVAGTIVNALGYSISNYAIRIVSGSNVTKIVATDNTGQFEAVPIFEGDLQISSMSVPRSTISGITLSAGQDLFLTLVVDYGDYKITGRIIDDGGQAIPDAQLKLSWSHNSGGLNSSSVHLLKSDASGNYRFQNVGPGLHTLSVAAEGYKNARQDIISEQQIGPLTITLNR